MYFVITIMMVASMFVLFLCGYYVRIIKEKYERSWLQAVPITVAILMFNVIWAIVEMGKAGRW
ncbi:MAG: hypothetical protein ACI4XL_06260 [Bacillus sp. (in: firmicutes)]